MLLMLLSIFDQIWPIEPEILQNVQKMRSWQKILKVSGLTTLQGETSLK